ncbi:MAG TPA: hypothetical protein VGR58_02175 [Candidatus Acidoferrum sp.]|nr:hypothetical protein [Candidatus Acidoferrum sp.]
MSRKLNMKSKIASIAFGLIGASSLLVALGTHLWGDRAPDVLYGDEINLPYGFVLLLTAIALQSGSHRVTVYGAIMTVACGFEAIWMEGFRNPFSIGWLVIWAAFVGCTLSIDKKEPLKLHGEMGSAA